MFLLLDPAADDAQLWNYMNIAFSSTMTLCATFEQNKFVIYVISIQNIKNVFALGSCH